MRKSRKNRFDWYSVSQRFSIRKYHIGAVSVLLGSCLLLNGIQAAAETQVAENTQPQVELVTEASPGGAVKAARQVTFTYKVVFVDSNGLTIKEDTLTHSISTTEDKATYSHTLSNLLLPEGYSLASNQDNKLTVTLLEGEVPTVYLNLDVLQVVEEEVVEETPVAPPAEEAGTKEEQATEKVEEPTLETAEEIKPEEKVVAEVPQAPVNETVRAAVVPTEPTNPVAQPIVPTSVDEAKHVLEQVTSEAEVLSSQAERLVATSDQENEALKTVAAATKLTATEATVTLNDSKATLEIVNAKIDAVRTNVEALVLELRKFLGTDVIEIALATTTNMNDGIGRPGYWTEEEEVLNKSEAVTTAVTKAQEQRIPAGYEVDPNPDRVTFLIYSLSNFQKDSEFQAGTTDGSYNLRYGTDYYITMSLDRIKSTGNIYARLVNKQDGSLVQEIEIPENTARHQFDAIKNGPKDKGTFSYRMSYTTIPFVTPAGVQSYVASININSGRGGEGKGSVVYSLLTRDTTSYNSYTGIAPTYLPDQVTNYYVKETALRPKSLLASYTHTAAISGDIFSISSPAEFADYELIESPTVTEAPAAANYAVGTPLIQFFPRSKSGRIIYITKEDGTSRFINFALNPDHVDFIESFKKYDVMSQNEFVVNGVEDLELNSRLATIEKYLADIETVKSDTSLSPDEQTNRLNELRTNYASEINSDANKFLITFVSQETAPLSANNGPDAITGSTTWSYTSNKYYLDGNRNSTFTAKLQPFYSDPLIDWAPNVPNSTGMLVHSKTEVDEKGRPLRLSIPKVDADGSPVMQNGSQVNAHLDVFNNYIAMFNFLNLNQNTQDYYYAEKGGVKVYYVDTAGTELRDPQFVFEHADTNTAYDTKSKLVDKIEKAGTDGTTSVYYYKEIDTAALKPASQNTDTEKRSIVKITDEVGIVERDTLKELTYVYELAGSVNVNYVDIDGNKLSGTDGAGKVVAEKVADTVNAKAGTEYDTIVDNRPAKIVTADGKTYELASAADYTVGTVEADHHLSVSNVTEVTGIHEATGSVTSGITKEITFVYKEVTGKVIVNFKSIDGKELQGPRTDTEEGSTGRDYNTEEEGEVPPTITKEGKTYKLVPNLKDGNPTGKVTPGTTEVTYYYQLVTGDVVVNYENTDGKVIAPQVVDVNDGNIGENYTTTDHKPEKIVEDGTGDVYYIKPTGTEVKTGDGLSGETGQIVEGTTQVTYIYEKAGNVKINYILDDADGTPLKDSVMDEENAKPGTAYDTTDEGDKPETISKDGNLYRLKEVKADSAAENGDTAKIVAGETLEVTYVYTKVTGSVVINYVAEVPAEDGTVTRVTIKTSVTDEDQVTPGKPYDTTDEGDKPTTITTEDGKTYELVRHEGDETGTVVEGETKEVTYVYKEVTGKVVVNFKSTDGEPLQDPRTDTEEGSTGRDYNTEEEGEVPPTITKDGKLYRLVPNVKDGNPTGKVTPGTTEVTYYYEPVIGDVIIKYTDTEGNTLKDTV
ncbi:TPA: MucBP domain-containing protein, partial [Streptococcus suis]